MSEDEWPRVEILVGGSWTEVYEDFDELRRRWRLAREHDDLLELTTWEGPLLLHPEALKAACNPVGREQDDEVDEVEVVWPEVDDPDMARAIDEVSGQHLRRSPERAHRGMWCTSAAGGGVRRTERAAAGTVPARCSRHPPTRESSPVNRMRHSGRRVRDTAAQGVS
jgi:hypothetical protein